MAPLPVIQGANDPRVPKKVEAGTRSANRLPILMTICKELRIDLQVLIGREPTRDTRECINDIQVEAIRAALERYDAIRNQVPLEYGANPSRLQSQVAYIWSALELADYHVISRTLPDLLLDAQRCHVALDNAETSRILAEVYQITASTLRKLGEYKLAWLAGDRGVALAERTGDPVLAALTGFRVAMRLHLWDARMLHSTSISRTHPGLNLGCGRKRTDRCTAISCYRPPWRRLAAGTPWAYVT